MGTENPDKASIALNVFFVNFQNWMIFCPKSKIKENLEKNIIHYKFKNYRLPFFALKQFPQNVLNETKQK